MILGTRVALHNRNVRKFVRGVRLRTEKARERGLSTKETRVEKPRRNTRASAIEMQRVRLLLREAEKLNARREYLQSEKVLIQALTLDPRSVQTRAELGKLYLLTDRSAKAEALYRELLAESSDISFHSNLGLACYRQEKFDAACTAYKDAYALDPRNPERAAALGRACMAASRLQEATEHMEKAAERLARDTDLLRMLAECYERLGHNRAAENAYMRIHRLQPYDKDVKDKIAELASV